MKSIRLTCFGFCMVALALFTTNNAAYAKKNAEPKVKLTAESKNFLQTYTKLLEKLRTELAQELPQVEQKQRAAFMEACKVESAAFDKKMKAQAAANNSRAKNKDELQKQLTDAEKKLAAAEAKTRTLAKDLLVNLDKTLTNDALDAQLVKCTVITKATPRSIAEFCQQGKESAALIEKLLADTALMKQMLIAEGASNGKFPEAMKIYSDILKASPRAAKGMFQRLALGTALEQAVPVKEFDLKTFVDPVKRYLHYEKAYLAGELDPKFKDLTVWEFRMVTNSNAPDEQIVWGREMMRNYRPDLIFNPDYRWRYARIVRDDVQYKSPAWTATPRTYQQLINGGGKCGPRAWFARFALRCFGIPTWGVRQRGHAACSHWTPEGWTVVLGAHWRWNWWGNRPGLDFLLETQARKYSQDYADVLRAMWIGDVFAENPAQLFTCGKAGFWNALGLQKKKIIVETAQPVEVGTVGEDVAEANFSTKAEKIIAAKITAADKRIKYGKDGVITIPASAFSKPQGNTKEVFVMKSFSGGLQLHCPRLVKKSPVFEYTIRIPKVGKYALTARVVTVNTGQHLLVSANDSKTPISIDMPYTIGMWEETKPVTLTLKQGENIIKFTRKLPQKGLSIKWFKLTPDK